MFLFFTIQVSGIGNKSKKILLHSLSGIFHCCLINSRFCLMFSILNLPTNIDICMRHVHLILSNSFCGLKLENEKKKVSRFIYFYVYLFNNILLHYLLIISSIYAWVEKDVGYQTHSSISLLPLVNVHFYSVHGV